MTAELSNGWITIPYDGSDTSLVEIGIGEDWYPAFLDYLPSGTRVAKIRPPAEMTSLEISIRVNGQATSQGYLRR